MVLWGIILLAVDMALMGAILYILSGRRKTLNESISKAEKNISYSHGLVAQLKEELKEVKAAASRLDMKTIECAGLEKTLAEKQMRLESVVKQAEDTARNIDLLYATHLKDDNYTKAMRLVKMGIPADEVTKNLGLLKGEFDLISSISSYKV